MLTQRDNRLNTSSAGSFSANSDAQPGANSNAQASANSDAQASANSNAQASVNSDAQSGGTNETTNSVATSKTPTEEGTKKQFPVKKLAIVAVVLLVAAVIGLIAYNYFSTFQETDDAYITAHIDPVSSRIEANVERIFIDDNQHVKAGQLLIELDSRDFDRQVDRARAELARVERESIVSARNIDLTAKSAQAARLNAKGDSSGSDALIEQSQVAITQARFALAEQKDILTQKQAELVRAKEDYKRYEVLEARRCGNN